MVQRKQKLKEFSMLAIPWWWLTCSLKPTWYVRYLTTLHVCHIIKWCIVGLTHFPNTACCFRQKCSSSTFYWQVSSDYYWTMWKWSWHTNLTHKLHKMVYWYLKGSEPYWSNPKSGTGNCKICTVNKYNKNLLTLWT